MKNNTLPILFLLVMVIAGLTYWALGPEIINMILKGFGLVVLVFGVLYTVFGKKSSEG